MAAPRGPSNAPGRPEVARIVREALRLSGAAREAYLAKACANDRDLLNEVASRLADASDVTRPPGSHALGPGAEVDGGRYRILTTVGRGGMGDVFKAHDRQLDRTVAIKAIRPELASDPETARRLVREARLAASLDHPFICEIHELLLPADGPALLVMEFVDGPTLKGMLEQGPIAPVRVIRFAREMAEALSVAHERGMVHRDIKPSNVIVTPHGHVKVLDFGIAKACARPDDSTTSTLSHPGDVIGTPAYMSPEQAAGQPVDQRSDVFSFGVLLYECLAGVRPDEASASATFRRWLPGRHGPRALPRHVPAELSAIVMRCLERRPEARFQSFAEIGAALDAPALSRLTASSTRTFTEAVPRNWRSWVWVAALAVVVAAGGLALEQWLAGGRHEEELRVQRPIVTWPTAEKGSRVSPDGTAVTFLSSQGGVSSLWVRSIDGSEPKAISGPSDALKTPVWSPDGRRIACLFRTAGQAWLQIATVWGEPAAKPRPLGGAWDDVALVRWIGAHLYFSVSAGSSASVLWRYDTADDSVRQVTHPEGGKRFTTSGNTINIDVRRDEARIVFVSAIPEAGRVWVADLDGRHAEPLSLGDGLVMTPRWRGADGRRILFVSNENGQFDIWEYDLDSRQRTALTTSPLAEESIDVSAGGDLIVADTVEQASHLWAVLPGAENAPKQLTNDLSDVWPSVAQNSPRVIFHRRRGSFVEHAPTDTEVLTGRWVDHRLEVEATVGAGANGGISADGRRIFFLRWPSDGTDGSPKPPELWVQDLAPQSLPARLSEQLWFPGNDVATWTLAGQTAEWGPAGADHLFFVRPAAGSGRFEIVRARLDATLAGTIQVLAATSGSDNGDERFSDIAVADDEAALAYVATSRRPYRGGRLMQLDLQRPADAPRALYEAPAGTQLYIAGWTRRATIIALVSSRPDQGNSTDVYEVDPRGKGHARRLTSAAGVLGMTAVLDRARDRLFATAVDGGVATVCEVSLVDGRRTTVVPNTLDGITFGGFAIMTDGWLLFMKLETNDNVWLFDFRSGSVPRPSQGEG